MRYGFDPRIYMQTSGGDQCVALNRPGAGKHLTECPALEKE